MTDTAKTGPEQTNTSTPRELIRESWVNYLNNITYDLTRSAVDFFLEGVLKEMSVYAKTTSEKNDTNTDKFKNLVGKFTDFVRPKTLALSDAVGSAAGYLSKKLIGNLIGQFYSAAKVQGYELDAKKKGQINKATTAFARANVKYMILGGLTFAGVAQPLLPIALTPEFLIKGVGSTLASLLTGAGLGLAGNQVLPKIYQFLVSKLPAKKPEEPKPETNKETKEPTPDQESKLETDNKTQKELTSTQEPKPESDKKTKESSSNQEPKLETEHEPEKEPTLIQTDTPEAIDRSQFIVHLRVKSPSTQQPSAITTKDSGDFIPLGASSEDEENKDELDATTQHFAKYTPALSAALNKDAAEELPKTPEINEEEQSYHSSASMSESERKDESDREENEYSSEHDSNVEDSEDDQLNRSRSQSSSDGYSSDYSENSSSASSRSPSPVRLQKNPYRRIR